MAEWRVCPSPTRDWVGWSSPAHSPSSLEEGSKSPDLALWVVTWTLRVFPGGIPAQAAPLCLSSALGKAGFSFWFSAGCSGGWEGRGVGGGWYLRSGRCHSWVSGSPESSTWQRRAQR